MLIDTEADRLLENTSRSFFLTLKVLPHSIRKQVGLLYLLARVADTIADSKTGRVEVLLEALEAWDRATSQNDVPTPRGVSVTPQALTNSARENWFDECRIEVLLAIKSKEYSCNHQTTC